jgi:hypothetical protein
VRNRASTLARLHRLDAEGWERHANPWSVWTRVPLLALFALAVWSRAWIGWWCLLPLALLALWTWLNPRAFPPPARTDSWSARGVLGERVWLNRADVPIPAHHARMAALTTALSLAGLPFLAWGLWALEPWPTVLGVVLATLGKLWFVDRMVWLYDEMSVRHPAYRAWLRQP